MKYSGRAWVFGDDVNTDDMYPTAALRLDATAASRLMFHASRPGWPDLVKRGDIVVGGRNFGIGSSRPVASLFMQLGVTCLVAEEFCSLFYRNSINYGLPTLTVPGIRAAVTEGDVLNVDVASATVLNSSTGAEFHGNALPAMILRLLQSGGLLEQLEQDGLLRSPAPSSGPGAGR